jgi:hypothetical protein
MAKYRLRTQQFCALSKELRFQAWLHAVAADLHKDLISHLENSHSCRDNAVKMSEIQNKLEKRNLIIQMVEFLKKEYPHAVERLPDPLTPSTPTSTNLKAAPQNEVFGFYTPALLTFPQKMILQNDDPDALRRDVLAFIVGKVSTDYIIIGNRAYIEYFKLKYAKEAEFIKTIDREIFQYRAKHGLAQIEHQIPASKIS